MTPEPTSTAPAAPPPPAPPTPAPPSHAPHRHAEPKHGETQHGNGHHDPRHSEAKHGETKHGEHAETKHSGARHGGTEPPAVVHHGPTPPWKLITLAALAAAALTLGIWSLLAVDPARIGGTGLVEAVPPAFFVAIFLSLTGFVATLNLRRHTPVLLATQVLVLVVILHSADPIIHGLPRLQASYRHLGIADYIAQSGRLDTNLDAYFNWPGFFDLLVQLSGATGVSDLMGLATWAPLGMNLLLLAPLLALARRLTSQPRQAWAGVWLFYLTSWVGQDYLAPQAYAFLLLVTLLACLLSAFSGWAWPTGSNRLTQFLARSATRLDPTVPHQGMSSPPPVDTAILLVISAGLLVAITASHQLTPFAAIPILALFLLSGRLRMPSLPILAVVLPVGWLVFVAKDFFDGHLTQLFGSFGDVEAHTLGALSERVVGSDSHVLVVYMRLAEVALVWLLAALGAFLAHRRRAAWLTAALGALAPLLLIPGQPYGGELMMRLYLFSLPFAACLAVLTLMPDRRGGPGWRRALALLAMGSVLASITMVTRYGNDSMEKFTPDEIALVKQLYATAPDGSILIEAVHNTPWQFQKYADYDYRALTMAQPKPGAEPLTCDAADRIAQKAGAYLIVTTSQKEAADLLETTPSGDLDRFIATCGSSPGWSKLFENAGGVVFHIQGAGNGN
ncbi:hypothetical protein [Arthrobacter sp. NPDC056493]|uniref:hypothetical protein n=1 Tax=Arthrobacter sp. NPDC056493 TaxID=3345839 RepID=UPI00366FA0F8